MLAVFTWAKAEPSRTKLRRSFLINVDAFPFRGWRHTRSSATEIDEVGLFFGPTALVAPDDAIGVFLGVLSALRTDVLWRLHEVEVHALRELPKGGAGIFIDIYSAHQ